MPWYVLPAESLGMLAALLAIISGLCVATPLGGIAARWAGLPVQREAPPGSGRHRRRGRG